MKKELFTWSFPISRPKQVAESLIVKSGTSKIQISEDDSLFRVIAGECRYVFNKNNGLLKEVQVGNTDIPFNNGPVLQEAVNNFGKFSYSQQGDTVVISSVLTRAIIIMH